MRSAFSYPTFKSSTFLRAEATLSSASFTRFLAASSCTFGSSAKILTTAFDLSDASLSSNSFSTPIKDSKAAFCNSGSSNLVLSMSNIFLGVEIVRFAVSPCNFFMASFSISKTSSRSAFLRSFFAALSSSFKARRSSSIRSHFGSSTLRLLNVFPNLSIRRLNTSTLESASSKRLLAFLTSSESVFAAPREGFLIVSS